MKRALIFIAGVSALYIAIVGGTIIAIGALDTTDAATLVAVFLIAAAVVVLATIAFAAPRLRHLHEATTLAESLAGGRFEARASVSDDVLAPLLTSMNAAAARVEALVAALSEERAQLEALLNASSDATVAVDGAGVVVYVNDAARSLFGGAGAATGRPFIEAVRDHDLNELMVAAGTRGERGVRVVAYGQEQRWLQATAVPIEGGGTWAALGVFHDLTEVRRLDSVRRDFISNVSHELRTPLAAIRAAAETLREGALDERAAALDFLTHIERETDRMTQLVEELLELSRIESGAAPLRFADLDARTLVYDTVARFRQQAERAGLTMVAEAPDEPLEIVGDGERLERALGNLVANAIKFTPVGGTVTVRAERCDGEVRVSVRDTGIGIEPEQRARVFERFYKADRGRGSGTGLGLAIVKHIVQGHGGSVEVESFPGRGSTFTMRLPGR